MSTFSAQTLVLAFQKRKLFDKITNSYRVVHAEADGLPFVVIDKYNDIWSIQMNSKKAESLREKIVLALIENFHPQTIIEKNLKSGGEILYGNKTITTVTEDDQSFELDVWQGQKTGAYLDYRNFRLKAKEFAHGLCLDAFCYQGWFSCQIAKQASRVIAVDASLNALKAAQKNANINGHKNIDFVHSDVFDFLKTTKQKFDFIHLDPPSFARQKHNIKTAIKGYQKLVLAALLLLKPSGIIWLSSCSQAITFVILEKIIKDCFKKSNHNGSRIYRGQQDRDHPVVKTLPESLYLKAIAYAVGSRGASL